jgi:hypothetical protein
MMKVLFVGFLEHLKASLCNILQNDDVFVSVQRFGEYLLNLTGKGIVSAMNT